MASTLFFSCKAGRTALIDKTIQILARSLKERLGMTLVEAKDGGNGEPRIELDVQAGIGTEGYRIAHADGGKTCRITGNDGRGLLYGVGKFLRHCEVGTAGPVGGRLCAWEGVSVPKLPVRGMYFATHFHNFYHDAPVEAVERYVEELALWGCNTLAVWFDMHHYADIKDPAAQTMIERLHVILRAANRVGIEASFVSLSNEAYDTSPVELRAEPFPHHYHREICPSKPGGMDLILRWRREMLEAFSDLEIGYFWIWPYDQGGCKCPDCKPWGGNGYVRNAGAVGRLVRQILPRTKIVVSTWEFGYWDGDAEWDMFYKTLAGKPGWVDYIMAEGHGDFPPYVLKHGPPGYPLLNFPEISMSGMGPWGGFGANLQPARLQKVWNTCRKWLAGGFPYSEGIFEDLNKTICLQLYWDPERLVEDIVREYAAAEFGRGTEEDVNKAVYLLEANMHHGTADQDKLKTGLRQTGDLDAVMYLLQNVKEPEKPVSLLDSAEGKMRAAAKKAWRWRILRLRAALDLELHRSGGKPTDRSDKYFEELCGIYHANGAEWPVSTPNRRVLKRLLPDWENKGHF